MRRLAASPELRDGIASFLFPRLYKFSAVATRQLTAIMLALQVRKLKTVHDVQMMVGRFIDHMVNASVDSLSWSGLAQLSADKPYLFVSNHRDITLDSALLNRVLHEEGFPTCQVAVGDNLFGTPHADDLMRLNRSFLVERSAAGPKATYAAMMRTSGYIRQSLESGVSVWIAQREGRAKDGFDRTEPALLKMLALAWRKRRGRVQEEASQTPTQALAIDRLDELLQRVQIVPVSISYELDPCDLLKAEELFCLAEDGHYTKREGADLASIVEGMRGYKGRVHLHFAQPLSGSFETAEEIAQAMDREIVGGLKIYPSNLSALAELDLQESSGEPAQERSGSTRVGEDLKDPQFEGKALEYFIERVRSTGTAQRPYLLLQYANLLRNRLALGLSVDEATLDSAQTSNR